MTDCNYCLQGASPLVQLSDLCKEGIAKMKNIILFYYVASKIKNTKAVFCFLLLERSRCYHNATHLVLINTIIFVCYYHLNYAHWSLITSHRKTSVVVVFLDWDTVTRVAYAACACWRRCRDVSGCLLAVWTVTSTRWHLAWLHLDGIFKYFGLRG